MAVKKDHSALPKEPVRNWAPDTEPRFGPALAKAWARDFNVQLEKPTAAGTRLRLSMAGSCARNIDYFTRKLERSNPMTLSDYWRMGLGTMVHFIMEPVIREAFPGATTEVLIDLREDGLDLSGSADVLVLLPDGTRVLIEWKTINGFGFKMMTGARGTAEGPKSNHIRQAAIAAQHLNCDQVVIGYLSMECLSQREADKIGADDVGKFIAEFTLTRDQYTPYASAEVRRQEKILTLIDEGKLAPRSMPDIPAQARIVDPAKGAWNIEVNGEIVGAGTTWMCGYCNQRDRCISDGPS